jgi:hypothetical protein
MKTVMRIGSSWKIKNPISQGSKKMSPQVHCRRVWAEIRERVGADARSVRVTADIAAPLTLLDAAPQAGDIQEQTESNNRIER